MPKKALVLVALVALMVISAGAVAMAASQYYSGDQTKGHVQATLYPVKKSGVSGKVDLWQLSPKGTFVFVRAKGLTPGKRYISLIYENSTCALEEDPDYFTDDIIGAFYTADRRGKGETWGVKEDDNLSDIHSVSVRSAKHPYKLLACARIGDRNDHNGGYSNDRNNGYGNDYQ